MGGVWYKRRSSTTLKLLFLNCALRVGVFGWMKDQKKKGENKSVKRIREWNWKRRNDLEQKRERRK